MKIIRVGAAALNQIPLDWEGNLRRALEAVAAGRAAEVSLLCLPELCLSGYGCEDAFHMAAVAEAAWRSLEALAPATRGMAVSAGLPVLHGGVLYNAAALLVDGRVAGLAAKRNLAGDGLHYEPRWFKPWPAGLRSVHASGVPIGDILFDAGGVRIGFEICEDAWVPDRPGAGLARRGADVLLNPSASHFAFGKQATRRRFAAEGSRAFGVVYVYANLLGNESGRAVYDGAALIATEGGILAEGPRFSYRDELVSWADADVDVNRMRRARAASFLPELDGPGLLKVPFAWPGREPAGTARVPAAGAAWEAAAELKEEEFTRAVALGLFDYLRKSRSRGFVVSLSGGADSSAVAALAALSLRQARSELGPEGFARKLGYAPDLGKLEGPELPRRMLATVFQGTENSSPEARGSARRVAAELGSEHVEWEVDSLVRGYARLAETALGRPLTWERDDLALQNIQARVRAPGVWMLANVRESLLLATSDRSEAAVGYATMDGDTAGGLSPIAGIDKAFLLRWLAWMGRAGPAGIGPVPALGEVAAMAPSPELRPRAAAQTAEGDLMPYGVLDAIERAFVRDKRSPAESLSRVAAELPGHPRERLRVWVARFYRLWCRSQWKRERYAPSFHLDEESLDPKGWCRFPILSGGFAAELAALDRGCLARLPQSAAACERILGPAAGLSRLKAFASRAEMAM